MLLVYIGMHYNNIDITLSHNYNHFSDKSNKALRDSVDKAVAKMTDIDAKIDTVSRYIMKKQKRVLVRQKNS